MPKDITIVADKSAFDQFEIRYALRNLTNSGSAGTILTRSKSKALQNTAMKRRGRLKETPVKVRRAQNSAASGAINSPRKQQSKEVLAAEMMDGRKASSPQVGSTSSGAGNANRWDLFEKYRKVQEVLGAKYVNVVDRLKLDYTPYCVRNMMFCSTHHSRKCPKPEVVDRYQSSKAKHLVDEERMFHFLKFVEDMCLRTEFPGKYILARLWELILTVNHPDNDTYSSKNVVDDCVLVFENILFKFPPCWYDIRDSYCKLLTEPFNLQNVLPSANASNQTILQFVLSMIAKVMTEADDNHNQSSQTLDSSEDFFNFQEWAARNEPKHNFEVLSRTDKLDRLFLILHLITKLLELDLSIWILRYLSKPNKHIYDDKGPLISKIFKFDLYHQITEPVKQVLKVFTSCVCFSYPTNQIDILSRMVSLLSVSINLCEKPAMREGIKYPNIGPITEAFAKEIFKTVDNCVGRSVSHYLSVIKQIRTPFIKYLVIDMLLCKMNPDPGQMCVKKIFNNFRNKRWLQCAEESPPAPHAEQHDSSCKYPVVPKSFPKPRASDIYREQYLDILLEAMKAYCDVYAVREVALLFTPDKNCAAQEGQAPKITRKIPDDKKLNLNRIERDIDKLTADLNMQQKRVHTELQLPKVEGIHVDDNVMSYYKEELKCLSMFPKNISILRQEYGNILDKWYHFTRNELFSVNSSSTVQFFSY